MKLRTLGVAGLFDGDALVLGPGKPLALLAYLALAVGRRASRQTLVDLLWADLDPERARSALRQSLFHLRRVIGDSALAGTEELAMSVTIATDRDVFLSALEQDAFEEAIATYGGEFLPNFGLPGGAAFEQWADLERGRLQTSFIRAGELVVRRHLNRGEAREGRRVARYVRDRAPQDESAWRLALEAAVSTRDFVTAGVEAAALEEWASSAAISLEPATRAALTRARRVTPPAEGEPRAAGLVAELTGREREFHAIIAAWDAVRTGASRHIHIMAAAGLGKTRLLRDALARLEAGSARILSLRGTPGDRDVPYAFAADLAAALATLPGSTGVAPASAATLLALNPALSALLSGAPDLAPSDEVMRRRMLALADLAQSVAHEQRFALAIDDVHWIDPSSLRVLEGVLARLGDSRVLCLTAARPECRLGTERTLVLPLGALSEAQVGALVAGLGSLPQEGTWPSVLVAGAYAASGGSPLLLLETLRLALDDGVLTLDGGEWRCADDVRLRCLLQAGEALRTRVRSLPDASRQLLALLATAGMPLGDDALAAIQRVTAAELTPSLTTLEQLGLAVRTRAGWLPAHDEIAEAARASLSDAERIASERALSDHLAREAQGDPLALLRAAHHARVAGNGSLVTQLYLRYAQRARQHGDSRSFVVIASEFGGADDLLVQRLASAAPWAWRLGLWSAARQRVAAAAAVVLLAVVGGAAWMRQLRENSLQSVFFADSARQVSVAAVRPEEWDGRVTGVKVSRGASPLAREAFVQSEYPPTVSPDGRSAVWTRDAGDSTTLDLWIRTPTGTRRLTVEPRDDIGHQWMPDGSGIVGTSNRWSPPTDGDYDVAIFDTATGAARQITHGGAHDHSPRVSPDGTRIAFLRQSEDSPGRLCVTPVDGAHEPDCRMPEGHPPAEVLGWSGPDEVVLILNKGEQRPLVRYDWSHSRTTELVGPHASQGQLSPDRHWVLIALRREGVRGTRDWILPLDATAKARPVAIAAGGVRWWEGRADQSSLIQRLDFSDTLTVLTYGIGTRLQVRSLTAAGAEVPFYAPVTWSSGDTAVATVDSVGEVRPRRAGTVTIRASLAGWREVRRTFRIQGEPPATILREPWDATWASRWLPWGDPAPSVRSGPGGVRGFSNNGDGTFVSMAVSRAAFNARQGLGVELRVSTPLTRTKWQRLRVFLAAGVDTAALASADQRKAAPSLGRSDALCGINFPESGAWGATRMSLISAISHTLDVAAMVPTTRTGAWWTLRIQLLPDGRCGIALNGRPLWLSPEPIPLDGDFRVRLGDESNGTAILHGPLEVWSGVRTDVDWSRKP